MFKRLIFDHWVVLFPIAAFVTASVIYCTIAWCAVRMRRPQTERLANLPLND
ncbi:MAG: hypothetical protein SFV32_09835 [Opitutaceae bacterium]|nr:hypothetical protein [Opitutaceae bacterium]